jgi:hypothetical protein
MKRRAQGRGAPALLNKQYVVNFQTSQISVNIFKGAKGSLLRDFYNRQTEFYIFTSGLFCIFNN